MHSFISLGNSESQSLPVRIQDSAYCYLECSVVVVVYFIMYV